MNGGVTKPWLARALLSMQKSIRVNGGVGSVPKTLHPSPNEVMNSCLLSSIHLYQGPKPKACYHHLNETSITLVDMLAIVHISLTS